MTTPVLTRVRNAGHAPLNNLIREDWRRLVEAHPDSFDAMIFLPKGTKAVPEQPDDEVALFGTVDASQQPITYEQPVLGSVLVATMDDQVFAGMWEEADQTGSGESETLSLLLSYGQAPVGTQFEWEEETSNGNTRRVWWYVQEVNVIGTASVGAIHICIPCGDLEAAVVVDGGA